MNIKVFLTYPTSAENKHFSVKNPNTLQYIENLKITLKFMEILKIFILSKNTFMTRLI